MDLVDFDQAGVRRRSFAEYTEFAEQLDIKDLVFIPISALRGRQHRDAQRGDALVSRADAAAPSRNRERRRRTATWSTSGSRCSTSCARTRTSGDLPDAWRRGRSRRARTWSCCRAAAQSRIRSVETAQGAQAQAVAGESVVLTIEDEIDISRGDMIVAQDEPAHGGAPRSTRWCAGWDAAARSHHAVRADAHVAAGEGDRRPHHLSRRTWTRCTASR